MYTKEQRKIYNKEYYEDNKERILEKRKDIEKMIETLIKINIDPEYLTPDQTERNYKWL
jgi:hypothetical protein